MDDLEIRARAESIAGLDLPDGQVADVLTEYKKAISLPPQRGRRLMVLCLVGLVGAGKTTVAVPISEQLGLIRVSTDELRKILIDKGFNLIRTLEIAWMLTVEYLSAGYSVAIDADCIVPEYRSQLREFAASVERKIVTVHINPPEDFILHKLRSLVHYNSVGVFRDADEAIANYWRRKLLHNKYLSEIMFDYTFDTSRDDLADQVARFVNSMKLQGY